jgi:hypothetical protein
MAFPAAFSSLKLPPEQDGGGGVLHELSLKWTGT